MVASAFAGTKTPPAGATWAIADIGALASLALFTLAASGLFKSRPWWERAASAGAIARLAALVPMGSPHLRPRLGPGLDSTIHIIGSAAVLLVCWFPPWNAG